MADDKAYITIDAIYLNNRFVYDITVSDKVSNKILKEITKLCDEAPYYNHLKFIGYIEKNTYYITEMSYELPDKTWEKLIVTEMFQMFMESGIDIGGSNTCIAVDVQD